MQLFLFGIYLLCNLMIGIRTSFYWEAIKSMLADLKEKMWHKL